MRCGLESVLSTEAACFSVHLRGVRSFSGAPGYGQSLATAQRYSQGFDAFQSSAAVGIKGAPANAVPSNRMVLTFAFGLAFSRHQGR